jgi:hypothetical protein
MNKKQEAKQYLKQQFEQYGHSVFSYSKDHVRNMFGWNFTNNQELAEIILDAIKDSSVSDYDYKQIARYIIDMDVTSFQVLLDKNLFRENLLPLIVRDGDLKKYKDAVRVYQYVDGVENQKTFIMNCINPEHLLKMLQTGVVDDKLFAGSKTALRLLNGFYNDSLSFLLKGEANLYVDFKRPKKAQIKNLKKIVDVFLNLKTNDNYSELDNINILACSMLHSSDIVEILSNKPRFGMMREMFNMGKQTPSDEDRQYILNRISQTHSEKLNKLFELMEKTNKHQIFNYCLIILTNHALPIEFNKNEYQEKVNGLIDAAVFRGVLNEPHLKHIRACVKFFFNPSESKIKRGMLGDKMFFNQIMRNNLNPVLLDSLKALKNVEFNIDMLMADAAVWIPLSLAYTLTTLNKAKVINLDENNISHQTMVSYAIKFGFTDKIENKNMIKSIAEKMLKNGEITKEQY